MLKGIIFFNEGGFIVPPVLALATQFTGLFGIKRTVLSIREDEVKTKNPYNLTPVFPTL